MSTSLHQLDVAPQTPSKSGTTATPLFKSGIFSPRPETPATPPSFPFLSTPSPNLNRSKTVAPPTPPRRPRTRQASSSDDVFSATKRFLNCNSNSFGSTLAAFPPPPTRAPPLPSSSSSIHASRPKGPESESLPLAQSFEQYFLKGIGDRRREEKKEESEEMILDETDEDSDGRTVTGVPATPSTASSGWDTFWSEPPSPADTPSKSQQELTEAMMIREAYLRAKLSPLVEDNRDEKYSHVYNV